MRVVRSPQGVIAIDPTGRMPGRGAYLCRDAACWDLAARRHALEHALKVSVPESILAALAAGPAATAGPIEHPTRATGAHEDTNEGGL